ncbi:ATP-binding protein [Streptomyces sp. OZ13]|uniref:ATP-binding protein n=1 Tax=Streptomyces sp. OZ13 TaxID=3452210 RepID=UPI003F8BD2CB
MSRPPLTLDLLATPAAVSGVRRALYDYGADLQLCATELLTNVIRHIGEGTPVTVRVSCGGGRTRLEVTDPDPRALPVLCGTAAADDESGRGLVLLDAMTLRWGVGQGPGGKTVWCELAAWRSGGCDRLRPGQGGSPQVPVVHGEELRRRIRTIP